MYRDVASISIRAPKERVREILLSPEMLPECTGGEDLRFLRREEDATLFRAVGRTGNDHAADVWKLQDRGAEVVYDLLTGEKRTSRTRFVLKPEGGETRLIMERERSPRNLIEGVQTMFHWPQADREVEHELRKIKSIVEGLWPDARPSGAHEKV